MYKYCGPYWSNGQWQSSVEDGVPSDNALDECCKEHDRSYARHPRLKKIKLLSKADKEFQLCAAGQGHLGQLFGSLVGINDLFRREHDRFIGADEFTMAPKKKTGNLRGSNASSNKKAKNLSERKKKSSTKQGTTISTAPLTIGTSISSVTPTSRATANGIVITGRDFASTVLWANTALFTLGALVPVNPVYYSGSILGNMSRTYQEYRFRRLTFHFVTRQPATTTGQIMLTFSPNTAEPPLDTSRSDFLPRVMAMASARTGPMWQNHSLSIDCRNQPVRKIDCLVANDPNDDIMGELEVYTQNSTTADTAGYLLVDYEIEFIQPMFQPHQSLIPVSTGVGQLLSLVTVSTTPTANDAATFTNTTITALNSGSVFKCCLILARSTIPTGATAANWLKYTMNYQSSTTVLGIAGFDSALSEGLTFYATVVSSTLYLYLTLDAALSGTSTAQVMYKTTGSTAGTIYVMGYQIQTGPLQIAQSI